MTPADRRSTRAKVSAHRARLRALGLRPIQIWVTDTRTTEFAARARAESLRIAQSSLGAEDQAFIDAVFAGFETGQE